MNPQHIAKQSIIINAPVAKVWDALVTPEIIKHYLFGTNVASDWEEGSPITWSGEWQGKSYVDKGVILKVEKPKLLRYTHFSPLSGVPDKPENYHTVTIQLDDMKTSVVLSLSQDNNPTEEAREHSESNWKMVLEGLKRFVENHVAG